MMKNVKDFELTKVEVVLHEFNRAAIDEFLRDNGFETQNNDWGKKVKQVLFAIERTQQNKDDKGA
jgi:O-methyltransferase involved in polyketide biosynthesis